MKRLKQLREAKKISQVRLAMELNTTQASISKYELGKSQPDVNTLIDIAQYFNVSTDYLLELSPFKNYEPNIQLSQSEISMLSAFNSLSNSQKSKAIAYINGLKDN